MRKGRALKKVAAPATACPQLKGVALCLHAPFLSRGSDVGAVPDWCKNFPCRKILVVGTNKPSDTRVPSDGTPTRATTAPNLSGDTRHAFLNSLVLLVEASIHAHLACTRNLSWGTEESRNKMAARLCALTGDLYALSPGRREIRTISGAEWREGKFQGGGRDLVFSDGRPTLSELALTREAFERAIEQLVVTSRP